MGFSHGQVRGRWEGGATLHDIHALLFVGGHLGVRLGHSELSRRLFVGSHHAVATTQTRAKSNTPCVCPLLLLLLLLVLPQVMGVVRQLQSNGQALEMNVIIDKLMAQTR
jgi:hypothetical protein